MSDQAPSQPYVASNSLVRSLHFDHFETQSRMSLRDPRALLLKYTQTMMGFLLFGMRPTRIAMIGLGGGSLAKFCYHYLPAARIDVAEINPAVIALREQFLVPADDHRFQVHLADGAEFIARSSGEFDVLMVDGYDVTGMPEQLGTQDFYDACRQSLRADGVLVSNLYRRTDNYDDCVARIDRAFGTSPLIVPDSECNNDIAFAWAGAMPPARPPGASRPLGFDAQAWRQLTPAMAKVRAAWMSR